MTFRLVMPARVSYIHTLTATRTKDLGPGVRQTDVTVTRTRVTITRSGGDGYRRVVRPLSMSMKRDGKKVEHPLLEVMAKLTLTYQLDKRGRIRSISGFEDLHKRMKASMPPRLFKMLSAAISPEAIKNKEIAEWNGRVGDFVGRSFTIGQATASRTEFPLPGGKTVPYLMATKVVNKKARCKPGGCVRVVFKYGTRTRDFTGFASGITKKLSKLVDPSDRKKMAVSETTIEGDGYRIIDPSTMLIYEEVNNRTMKMVFSVPGKGRLPGVVRETRVHSFAY